MLQPNQLIALKGPTLRGPLHQLPLIEAVGTSDGWGKWREVIGPVLQPDIFVDSYGAALHMAAQGNGVALVSALLAQSALHSGELVLAHDAHLPSTEGYFLRVNAAVPSALAFRDWLLERLARRADVTGP